MPDSLWGNILYSLAPTVLIGVIFWFVMRAIIKADSNERKAYASIEAKERKRFEAERASSASAEASADTSADS